MKLIKDFLKEEDGLGTVELVLILAGLVAIAVLFKNTIRNFVDKAMGDIFQNSGSKDTLGNDVEP